jgi:hypothetical protein
MLIKIGSPLILRTTVMYLKKTQIKFTKKTSLTMLGRGICEKYQSRDEKFPEPNGEGILVSRMVFFANTPPKHDISV